MERDTIAILMATYNGEKYLKEQIDSILAQTNQNWHLYIHDDGSQDGTVSIAKSYTNEHPERITLLDYPPQGGACQNFLSLLERVEAPYYMFCDQDDIWLPEKIELSIKEIEQKEALSPDKGIVVCTDLHIVSENRSVLHDSMWKYSGIHPQYIRTFDDCGGVTAIATGSTMLFNQKAKASCVRQPSKATMHDTWVCLCTLKGGGQFHGINKQLVLYRQHAHNCLGSGDVEASAVDLRYRLRHFRRMYEINRRYFAMLSLLGYGSLLKYIRYKIKYKLRIKRGHY